MRFKDQLQFVRQNMKKNKSRLFMTVLATAMGCAFLTVLASVGFGLQQSIVDRMVGDRLVTSISVYGKEQQDGVNRQLTKENLDFLRSIEHVKSVTYKQFIPQPFEYSSDGQALPSENMQVLDFAEESKAGLKLAAGALPRQASEVLVGYNFGQSYEDSEMPDQAAVEAWVGKTLQFDVLQYVGGKQERTAVSVTISGVKAAPAKEWQLDRTVYAPVELRDQLEQIAGTRLAEMRRPATGDQEAYEPPGLDTPLYYTEVAVIADKVQQVKKIAEQLREQGYYNYSIADELSQMNVMFTIMQIGLVFVGAIAVLIASIGIYNTMTMAVTERAQDIGIMKAIGAHPKVIRRIFLLESAMIGIVGAAVGTLVAYVLSMAVNWGLPVLIKTFMEQQVPEGFRFSVIPLYLTVISCTISLGVALLSGARPAARATRVDVLRALRRDI